MEYIYDGEKMRKIIQNKRIIDLNISMEEAAKQIGISKATLSRLENGKEPDARTWMMLNKWVDVSPFEQFYYEKKRAKKAPVK